MFHIQEIVFLLMQYKKQIEIIIQMERITKKEIHLKEIKEEKNVAKR